MNERILRFLKKNWLTIVLAIVPPIVIWYFFQRESFELTVTTLVDVPVVSVRKEYGGEIELRYRGAPVSGLRVVELEIANTGNKPLERTAFDSPVTFGFGSGNVTDPVVLNKHPVSLQPILRNEKSIITIEPLLLNPRDSFSFRTFVIGSNEENLISVSGRVRGVPELVLKKASDNKPPWQMAISIALGILGGILSIISFVRLGIRAKSLTFRLPFGLVVELNERLEKDPRTAAKAAQLATELEISQHDTKANLLFLRIRIEGLLRDLARRADLPRRYQMGSIQWLSEQFVQRGIIPQDIASAIADISPSLNRELHEIESYLSPEEYMSLQRLSLNVIAGLTMALDKYTQKQTS